MKLVRGIGFNDKKYPAWSNGGAKREHTIWKHMLERCTEDILVKRPTYASTTCSEKFKSYTFFYKWCQTQIGFNCKDENGKHWHLDKDLLVKGNKIYGEDTCVFIPARINSLLTKHDSARGGHFIGVHSYNKTNRFMAKCCTGKGVQKNLGYFDTPQEAFQAYKVFKEALIKQVANEYKPQLDQRAYEALMNYEVDITD